MFALEDRWLDVAWETEGFCHCGSIKLFFLWMWDCWKSWNEDMGHLTGHHIWTILKDK